MSPLRPLAALSAAMLLAACNTVVSDKPLVFAQDEAGAPRLRDGLWMQVDAESEAPCDVDTSRPVEQWPKCAEAFVVRGAEVLNLDRKGDDQPDWSSLSYVLAAGEPRLWQIPVPGDDGRVMFHAFLGLEAVRVDADGRIVEYRAWSALCGPPPPPGTTLDGKARYGTLEPFAGLTMEPDANNCRPADVEAVRRAVQASRTFKDAQAPSGRWVRDGWR